MTVSERALGFEEPIQLAKAARFAASYRGLSDAGYAYLLSDTALAPERWRRFKVIVVSSFEYMDSTVQRALVDFATSGGTVVLGPRLPVLDEQMRPNGTLPAAVAASAGTSVMVGDSSVGRAYSVGAGRVVLLTEMSRPASALNAALGDLGLLHFSRSDGRLDIAIHAAGDDESRLIVFVANPTAVAIDAEIDLHLDLRSVRELWEDRPVTVQAGKLHEAFPPYTIYIYECVR